MARPPFPMSRLTGPKPRILLGFLRILAISRLHGMAVGCSCCLRVKFLSQGPGRNSKPVAKLYRKCAFFPHKESFPRPCAPPRLEPGLRENCLTVARQARPGVPEAGSSQGSLCESPTHRTVHGPRTLLAVSPEHARGPNRKDRRFLRAEKERKRKRGNLHESAPCRVLLCPV